jgi:hypothetical protein
VSALQEWGFVTACVAVERITQKRGLFSGILLLGLAGWPCLLRYVVLFTCSFMTYCGSRAIPTYLHTIDIIAKITPASICLLSVIQANSLGKHDGVSAPVLKQSKIAIRPAIKRKDIDCMYRWVTAIVARYIAGTRTMQSIYRSHITFKLHLALSRHRLSPSDACMRPQQLPVQYKKRKIYSWQKNERGVVAKRVGHIL